MILLLLIMGARGSNRNQEYAFLRYMDVIRLIDKVHETLWCLSLKWILIDEVDHSLRQAIGIP